MTAEVPSADDASRLSLVIEHDDSGDFLQWMPARNECQKRSSVSGIKESLIVGTFHLVVDIVNKCVGLELSKMCSPYSCHQKKVELIIPSCSSRLE